MPTSSEPIELLKQLIAIPSVNPMGRDVSGAIYFESRLSDFLCEFFENLGVKWERIEVAPGRDNVLARYEGGEQRKTILLDAHQDTVPVDGMTIEPFDPKVEDGKIFGRGACDVKGGLAAMLTAFSRLVEERPAEAANVVMSCTCDEEATTLGINDLTELWRNPERESRIIDGPPDMALVAEPTELDVVVAHRGATRWKIQTTGRACHSSRPLEGINAIYRMAKVLDALEEFAERLPEMVSPHPLCGPATLSVGRIEGGASVNTVPDWCAIEIDRRVIPGEDGWEVRDQVGRFLEERLDFSVEMLSPWLIGTPLSDEENGPAADRLLRHIESVVGAGQKVGVPYGTHASRIAAGGVPAMVFGPGSIAQAHTKDEWLELEQLHQAEEIYYRFCAAGG